MTITLPFPTSIGAGYDTTPGNNNDPPPKGAPEGQAPSTVNDAARDTKAGVAQDDRNIVAINAALGTMAEQDANAVSISGGTMSGGTLTSGVTVAVSAALGDASNNVSLQGLFDLIYPVNDAVVLRHDESPPPAWPGISATWTLISGGFFLKPITTGQTVGETFGGVAQTDPATVVIDGTALTEAQLPAHRHSLFASDTASAESLPSSTESAAVALSVGSSSDNYAISKSSPTTLEPNRARSSEVGSDQTHAHTSPSHVHTLDDNPPFYRIAVYRRTA